MGGKLELNCQLSGSFYFNHFTNFQLNIYAADTNPPICLRELSPSCWCPISGIFFSFFISVSSIYFNEHLTGNMPPASLCWGTGQGEELPQCSGVPRPQGKLGRTLQGLGGGAAVGLGVGEPPTSALPEQASKPRVRNAMLCWGDPKGPPVVCCLPLLLFPRLDFRGEAYSKRLSLRDRPGQGGP